jgi:hypothetical protein
LLFGEKAIMLFWLLGYGVVSGQKALMIFLFIFYFSCKIWQNVKETEGEGGGRGPVSQSSNESTE